MVQFSPDETHGNQTANVNSGGYAYSVNRIRGFGLTHVSGTGCGGARRRRPVLALRRRRHDVARRRRQGRDLRSRLHARQRERRRPATTRSSLDTGVNAELTATHAHRRGPLHLPGAGKSTMLVRTCAGLVGSSDAERHDRPRHATRSAARSPRGNFCGNKNLDGNPDRTSYYTLYFVAKFDSRLQRLRHVEGRDRQRRRDDRERRHELRRRQLRRRSERRAAYPTPGKGSGAYVQFGTPASTVGVRVGVSYVDAGRRAGQPRRRAARRHELRHASRRPPTTRGTRELQPDRPQRRHRRPAEDLLHRALPLAAAHERLQRRQRPLPRHGPADAHARRRPARAVRDVLGLGHLPPPGAARHAARSDRRERHGAVALQPVHAGRQRPLGSLDAQLRRRLGDVRRPVARVRRHRARVRRHRLRHDRPRCSRW